MIQSIIQSIKPKITTLPFVEIFGGLAVPVSRYDEVTNENGQIIGNKITTFPVTCGMDAINCFQNGKYQDLAPNSTKSSIFYFEEIAGLRLNKVTGPKGNVLEFVGKVRLVGWLNLQKLGHTDKCSIAPFIIIPIMKSLYEQTNLIAPLAGTVKFSNFNIVPTGTNLFARYSYSNDIQLSMFPYESLGIDMNINVTIGKHCVDNFELGIEVDCLDLTEI